MQINKDYEPEIKLRDIFFHILYRWRSILIAAILGAIILGGYQYLSVKKIHASGKLTKDERQYQLDLQDYQEDLEGSKTQIATLTKRLEGQRKYQNKSIYIQLDAQNVWTAESKYLVKIDQNVLNTLPAGSAIDPADSILPIYTSPLSGDLDEQALKEAFNTEEVEYVNELVSINQNATDNTISVYIRGSNKENVEKGIDLIDQLLKKISVEKAQEIYTHELVLLSKTTYLGADEELAKKQADLTKAMNEDQQVLQQARTNLDDLEAKGQPTKPSDHVKKMAIIGCIIGAFLLAWLYLMSYVVNGYVKNSSIMLEKYNLPILGEFYNSGSLHKGKGLDKFIAKWENKHNKSNVEAIYCKIVTLIGEQSEAKEILFLSTLPTEKLLPIQKQLSSNLSQKTINVIGSFLSDNKAIAEATKAEAVVLVEGKNISRQQDVDMMVEALIISKANAIGAILI